MTLDNDYYIVKFQAKVDYEKELAEGPWAVYGQYLTVQPWTLLFNTQESFPIQVVLWIRLSCFLRAWYKKCLLEALGSIIGQVVKVDGNTENGYRGCFARMVVCVGFRRPLITKIREECKV